MPRSIRRFPSALPVSCWFLFALCTALAAPRPVGAESAGGKTAASGQRPAMDSATVRKYYMDGDFEPAIVIIEDGLKSGRPISHADSIFAFKHLGVMYAARYETREKGKYYMHQLLMTEPTARIMDMYASDMIYMIFKNIQDEFISNRTKVPPQKIQPSETASDRPVPLRNGAKNNRKTATKSRNYYWIGATGLLVAAGVGAYFIMADPSTGTKDHPIQ